MLNKLVSYCVPILIVIYTCFALPAFAQKASSVVIGKIVDAGGQPVSYVSVQLKASSKTTVTAGDGSFILRHLRASTDTLIISSIDSKFISMQVILHGNDTVNIGTQRLEYYVKTLQDVEIKGRIAQSYKSDYSFFGNKAETPVKDIPQSISTVTKELIQDKMEFTLKDAMDEVSGVNQYSGFDEYTIRGFRAENSRDINGLRGYNTTYTSSMLVNIERVEVIKGPTATLYGNCDPGGTINLVTKKPLEKYENEIDVFEGSWGHFRTEGDFTGPLTGDKTLMYRFNAGYDNTGSFRNEQYAKSYEIAPSLTYIPNDRFQANVDLSVSNINTVLDWGQPGYANQPNNVAATPISLSASQNGDYLRETDVAAIATVSYKISKNISFNSGFLHYTTSQYVHSHGVQGYITPDSVNLYYTTWSYPTTTNTISNYLTYKFNGWQANNELIVGYDYIRSTVNLNQQYYELPGQFGVGSGIVGTMSLRHPQYTNPPLKSYQLSGFDSDATDVDDNIYHTQGIYIQEQANWNKWSVLVSFREEFYKGDDVGDSASGLAETVFLPRVGVVYKFTPNISGYATYNKGFDAFEASTSTQIFDQPFKPQLSELEEAGVKGNFLNNALSASIALYQLTVENVAVSANVLSNPNLYIQQGQNRSRGAEAEAEGNILPNLSVDVSYAYCNAIVSKSTIASQIGTRVENAPYNTSGSWVKYTFNKGPLKGFGIAGGHSGVGARATLDPTTNLPGYLVINGSLRYTNKHIIVACNLNNITNETYWSGAYNNVNKWPGAPRNFMINVGYKF